MTYTTPVIVAEVTAFRPGAALLTVDEGYDVAPRLALAQLADAIEATGTVYASDVGYRTSHADPAGVVPYRARITESVALTRAVDLSPGADSVAVAWGSLSLSNIDGLYNGLARDWNNDGRAVRLLWGNKSFDPARGYWTDPAYADLAPLFIGIGAPWALQDQKLSVPLRDATYWLDRPLQQNYYGGTGGLDGTATLAATPKPKTRGAAWNVTPILVDPAHLIYQYTDGPGTVVALWEGAKSTYTSGGNVSDLYSGSTSPGQYRTDNARGLFQLGTQPSYQVTVDVTGEFPVAGAKTKLADIAHYLLTEEAGLPTANLDAASFAAVATAYPATGGWHFAPGDNATGVAALSPVLAGIGAKLVPQRDGTLGLFVLRSPPGSAPSAAYLSPLNVVSVTPRTLPSDVNPPPYRIRAGYKHNNTVQASGLNPTASTSQAQYAAVADQLAGWSSTTVLAAYARPNDLAPVVTALAGQSDAASLASDWGSVFGVRRRLLDVVVPFAVGVAFDIGDTISLTWPVDDLINGVQGLIVGDNIQTMSATFTLTVLV